MPKLTCVNTSPECHDCSWEYTISKDGKISVRTFALFDNVNVGDIVSPMLYLDIVTDDNKNRVAGEMLSSVKSLEGKGYSFEADVIYKTSNASRVLQLMDSDEDGCTRFCEYVKLVSRDSGVSREQLEIELAPFI